MNHAPIAIFGYRRPQHLAAAIRALRACEGFTDTRTFVFLDGPREAADGKDVEQTRAIARSLLNPNTTVYRESDTNKGLARSITEGVTELVEEYGRVIVLEDDLIVAPDFLKFMNLALDRYVDVPSVMQISGHMFRLLDNSATRLFFLPVPTSWGWATWRRAWLHYDADLSGAEKMLRDYATRLRFNIGGTYNNSGMLKAQIRGKIDSWAIAWQWHVFRLNGLTLYPSRTKVINKGFDAAATHGFRTVDVSMLNQDSMVAAGDYEWPGAIATDELCFRKLQECFLLMNRSVLARIKLARARFFF